MTQVAIILTDAERRILWVNHDFELITGYQFGEVFGLTPGDVLQGPETEADAIERIRAGLKSQKSFKESITNYRKNGEPYICKLVIHPVFDRFKRLVNFLAFEVDGNSVKEEDKVPMLDLHKRYRTSSLRGVEELRLYERIRQLFKEEKVYLDPSLNLRKLSDMVDTNTKYLSQVINHYSGSNFLTFINGYRVAAVKERILNEEYIKMTFFGIAQLCGFKNKSTFYKVFRDVTGMTPKGYVEQIELEAANETERKAFSSDFEHEKG